MKRLVPALLLCVAPLAAQIADRALFRGIMLSSNEVSDPPITVRASGVADVWVHVVRDRSGQIISGTVDFMLRATDLPPDTMVTGFHIHNAPAGVNAGVVISSGLSATPLRSLAAIGPLGGVAVLRSAHVNTTDTMALAAIRGLFQDPSQYYINLHTSDFPNGLIRGQLQRAEYRVLMAFMSSDNEVPPPTNIRAGGVARVMAVATRDAAGKLTSGEVDMQIVYNFPSEVTFTAFHIHPGSAGLNGPASIGLSVPAGTTSESSGTGVLNGNVQISLENPVMVDAFERLFRNPLDDYINLHTTANTGGVIRAQLRETDEMIFEAPMDSANEPPAPALVTATGPATVLVYALRNEDGSLQAATVIFDVNYRFPGQTNITAMHIHDAKAGVQGSVTVPADLSQQTLASDTGLGNLFVVSQPFTGGQALFSLEDMLVHPENHYLNVHTTVSTGGAIRAQLAAENTAPGVVTAVISANLDKNVTTVAPGGLMSIWGTNLARVNGSLRGWEGKVIPDGLNGVAVVIGGRRARLLYVGPRQINAQVPLETPLGAQLLSVHNGTAPSAPVSVQVAAAAPAIFFSGNDGVIIKSTDSSLVSADNPVRSGDSVIIFVTGLGQTTPALTTGALVTSDNARTATVTATIGGKDATVVSSVAAQGLVGVYLVTVRVPDGVAAGNAQVVLKEGAATSNSVGLAVR